MSLQELTNVPVHRLIQSTATGIARAQYELDLTSIKIAQLMAGVDESSRVPFGKKSYSLLELGFTPTFYQFVDTVIEIKVSISTSSSSESSRTNRDSSSKTTDRDDTVETRSSSVSAAYSSKYQYSTEGSSFVRTKIVPVPAPALLQERIRALAAGEEQGP
ncbi:MAG: hypothetical protein KDK70_23250 [Myxococcales bacterium]|nr:hypothetical protein [Myxococcales bacterium]